MLLRSLLLGSSLMRSGIGGEAGVSIKLTRLEAVKMIRIMVNKAA